MEKTDRAKKWGNIDSILCNDPHKLLASPCVQEFMDEADVGMCYRHLVDIAQEHQDIMKQKLGSTMQEFGKFAWGTIGGWIGSAGGYFAPKERILQRLIGAKKKVGDVFLSASDQQPSPSKKSIRQMQQDAWTDEIHAVLPKQIATLCVQKVIYCMEKKKQEVIEKINNVHKKVEKKEWTTREKIKFWAMGKVIPPFIDHCIANKKNWQLFFAELALRDDPNGSPQDDQEEEEEGETSQEEQED